MEDTIKRSDLIKWAEKQVEKEKEKIKNAGREVNYHEGRMQAFEKIIRVFVED